MIDACDAQLGPLDRELRRYARRQAGCLALMGMFGVGPLISAAILGELGDARRFSSSRHAVRFAGLDVTVYSSDARRSPVAFLGRARACLRWAVYEAAQTASRPGSPDHAYYLTLAARLGKSRAKVALARKLLRRSHHMLRELGDHTIQHPVLAASRRARRAGDRSDRRRVRRRPRGSSRRSTASRR